MSDNWILYLRTMDNEVHEFRAKNKEAFDVALVKTAQGKGLLLDATNGATGVAFGPGTLMRAELRHE